MFLFFRSYMLLIKLPCTATFLRSGTKECHNITCRTSSNGSIEKIETYILASNCFEHLYFIFQFLQLSAVLSQSQATNIIMFKYYLLILRRYHYKNKAQRQTGDIEPFEACCSEGESELCSLFYQKRPLTKAVSAVVFALPCWCLFLAGGCRGRFCFPRIIIRRPFRIPFRGK